MGLRGFLPGAVFGALISIAFTACATGFGYKFYALDLPDYTQGVLRGPVEADDIKMEVCKPNDLGKAPCTVFITAEFEALKADLEDTRQKLKECQSPR